MKTRKQTKEKQQRSSLEKRQQRFFRRRSRVIRNNDILVDIANCKIKLEPEDVEVKKERIDGSSVSGGSEEDATQLVTVEEELNLSFQEETGDGIKEYEYGDHVEGQDCSRRLDGVDQLDPPHCWTQLEAMKKDVDELSLVLEILVRKQQQMDSEQSHKDGKEVIMEDGEEFVENPDCEEGPMALTEEVGEMSNTIINLEGEMQTFQEEEMLPTERMDLLQRKEVSNLWNAAAVNKTHVVMESGVSRAEGQHASSSGGKAVGGIQNRTSRKKSSCDTSRLSLVQPLNQNPSISQCPPSNNAIRFANIFAHDEGDDDDPVSIQSVYFDGLHRINNAHK